MFVNTVTHIQMTTKTTGNKFTAFRSGELHIANVDISDLQRTYGCKMRNTITNKVSSSSGLAQLIVTESSASQLEATGKLLRPTPSSPTSSSSSHEINNQFANPHLAKQTTSQVLHSVSQIVNSDQFSDQQLHIPATDSDKSSNTNEWRLLLPCAVRTLSASSPVSVGGADESSKLFEMRWFFQASSLSSRREDTTQKPIIPLEQYAAASSISLQYLNFVGQSPPNSSSPIMTAMKSSSRSQVSTSSGGGGIGANNNNNSNNNNRQDKSTKFVVGPTFLAIEWPQRAQSGRYVCQLVSRTQDQSSQEALSRTVCDINVIIRQPMKLKVKVVTKLSSGETTTTTGAAPSNPTNAALFSSPQLPNESTTKISAGSGSSNLLIRAIDWFSRHTSLSDSQADSLVAAGPPPITGTISQRSRRNNGPSLKRQALFEEESSRIQVQGSGLIDGPPIFRVGERLQLDCLGSGHPIEIVRWFKNGQAINTQSSSDFQIEITSIGGNNILNNPNEMLINEDMVSLNQQQMSSSQSSEIILSSLVIRQLQPRETGLAMFECFTYNSFGDKARAGLPIMIVERQLLDWARSVCLVNNREENSGSNNNSAWSGSVKQWGAYSGGGQEADPASIGLPEYRSNAMAIEEGDEFGNDWSSSNSLIFKRNNPLKQALLLESEPVELSCPSQRFLRSNLLMQQQQQAATQNLSARLDWRRWSKYLILTVQQRYTLEVEL